MKKIRKTDTQSTDLAVNTQADQHEEDQEDREIHSQPTWQSILRQTSMKKTKTERHTLN